MKKIKRLPVNVNIGLLLDVELDENGELGYSFQGDIEGSLYTALEKHLKHEVQAIHGFHVETETFLNDAIDID